MKYLVFGANGFIGKHVLAGLLSNNYDAKGVVKAVSGNADHLKADLTDVDSIRAVLKQYQPDVIVNCAGIIAKGPEAQQNVQFSINIINAVVAEKLPLDRLIIMGSASEYGVVKQDNPISEDHALNPVGDYGQAKTQEVAESIKLAQEVGIKLFVVRPFNPVGTGMNPQQSVPRLVSQFMAATSESKIEVNRFDSQRDYFHIDDLVDGIICLATIDLSDLKYSVYNLGSGQSTSVKQIADMIGNQLEEQKGFKPEVVETETGPEPPYAASADISRMLECCNWQPKKSLEQAVNEVIDEYREKN